MEIVTGAGHTIFPLSRESHGHGRGVINASDAEALQLNHRGLSQDYGNQFSALLMFFDPGNPPELQQLLLERARERIEHLPGYLEHVAQKIAELRVSCTLEDIRAEAEHHKVDLGLFDRVISRLRELDLTASDRLDDPTTQEKIFKLRLWVYLAEEYLFDWDSKGQARLGVFRVTESDVAAFRGAHADVFRSAA